MVLFDDLEELTSDRLAVSQPLAALLFTLLDGTRDAEGVARDWVRLTGSDIPRTNLDALLRALDEAFLLEGPAVEAAREAALAAYRARPTRPMAHGGVAYPPDASGLRARMAEIRAEAASPRLAGPVRAVLAPHIDPRGGGACHGAAIEALAASPAEVFVVLGTAHEPLLRPFALTTQDFETPTGRLVTDRDLVRRLAERGGGDLLADERRHGREHSVEFQAVWIHALHGLKPGVRVLPMLVGSVHGRIRSGGSPMEDAPMRDMVAALRELRDELGERVAFVASVDFAHVGPNYGGDRRPSTEALADVMERDRELLARAEGVDPEGWIRYLQGERDARSVCGAAPTYLFLQALAGSGLVGRTLRHDLWEIDPATGSHVSFAAVAYAARGAPAGGGPGAAERDRAPGGAP